MIFAIGGLFAIIIGLAITLVINSGRHITEVENFREKAMFTYQFIEEIHAKDKFVEWMSYQKNQRIQKDVKKEFEYYCRMR
jgi:hypothetical protein